MMMGQGSKFVHTLRFRPISRFFFTPTTSYKCSKLRLDSVFTQVALKVKALQQQGGNLVFQPRIHSRFSEIVALKASSYVQALGMEEKIISAERALSLAQARLIGVRWTSYKGRYLSSGSILGVSIASASVIAHAMDAGDALVGDTSNDSLDSSEQEENVHHLWKLARKFWLPVFFFLTVLTNFDDPIMILFIKVTLFLLSTKPNPFSVYIFVDQLCERSMRQDTRFFKVKLYASKVEVQDYKLLCLATVEVRDQKYTLVGILGTWWTLPHLPFGEAFSFVRSRLGSILVKTTEQSNLLI